MPEEFVPGMIGPLTGMPVKFVPGIVLLTGISMPEEFVRIIRSVDIVLAINHSKKTRLFMNVKGVSVLTGVRLILAVVFFF